MVQTGSKLLHPTTDQQRMNSEVNLITGAAFTLIATLLQQPRALSMLRSADLARSPRSLRKDGLYSRSLMAGSLGGS